MTQNQVLKAFKDTGALLEGHFILDCPMAWDGGDMSEVYGLPLVMAVDPGNMGHMALIAEIGPEMREKVLADRSHPISGFLGEENAADAAAARQSRYLHQLACRDTPVGENEQSLAVRLGHAVFEVGAESRRRRVVAHRVARVVEEDKRLVGHRHYERYERRALALVKAA